MEPRSLFLKRRLIPNIAFLLLYALSVCLTSCGPQVEVASAESAKLAPTQTPQEKQYSMVKSPIPTYTSAPSPTPEAVENGQDYLMITIKRFVFEDTEDTNTGEVSISSSVNPLYMENNRWQVEENSSQGNHYPYPIGLWQEVDDKEMVNLNMPIYIEEWDAAPENLSIFLYATDNDEWPKWLYLSINTLAEGLNLLGNFSKYMVDIIEDLGDDAKKELFKCLFGETALPADEFSEERIGITGYDLTPKLAKAMDLDEDTEGIIIHSVDYASPAYKAKLSHGYKTIEVDGFEYIVGSDILTAIDNQKINSFASLDTYLKDNPKSGNKVTLTILRNGESLKVDVTLEIAPASDAGDEVPTVIHPKPQDESTSQDLVITENDIMDPSSFTVTFYNNLPESSKKRIVGDTWFTTTIVNHFWNEFLEDKGMYEYLNIAEKYGFLSKALGAGMKSMLNYFTESEVVFQSLLNTDDLAHIPSANDSNQFLFMPNHAPNKANDWGIPEGGNSATYRICDAEYYEENKSKLEKDQDNLCDGTYVEIEFQKVSTSAQPIEVSVWLKEIKFLDVKESGTPEIFIHTRTLNTNMLETDLIDQMFIEAGYDPEHLDLDNVNKLNMELINSSKRFPNHKYSQRKFYGFPEDKWIKLEKEITPSSLMGGYITDSPFLFFEISIYEDDTGGVFEDAADWIMNYTHLLDLNKIELNNVYEETIQTENAEIKIEWQASLPGELNPSSTPTPTSISENLMSADTFDSKLPAVFYLGFNHAHFPFCDADVRRAFSAAINREILANAVNPDGNSQFFVPASALVPGDVWQEFQNNEIEFSVNSIQSSPDLAKVYLEMAYEHGFYENIQQFTWWPKVIRLAYIDTPINIRIAKNLAEEISRNIGVRIEPVPLAEEEFLATMMDDENAPEMYLGFISSSLASPLPYFDFLLNSQGSSDILRYEDPDLQFRLFALMEETDPEIQLSESLQIEKLLLEDYAVIAPLLHFNANEFDFYSGNFYLPQTINPDAAMPEIPTMTPTTHTETAPTPSATDEITLPTAPSEPNLVGSCLESGLDRRGSDYAQIEMEVETADPLSCMQMCLEDSGCLAFTYVEPGIQGENACCWLKNAVPDLSQKEGCTSGVREECLAGNPQFE